MLTSIRASARVRGWQSPRAGSPSQAAGHRRSAKPVRKLTRNPAFDGTTATLTGTFRTPTRNVFPIAAASAAPTGVRFGPTPNSNRGDNLTGTSPYQDTDSSLAAAYPKAA